MMFLCFQAAREERARPDILIFGRDKYGRKCKAAGAAKDGVENQQSGSLQ
jgi:hypothetical protein